MVCSNDLHKWSAADEVNMFGQADGVNIWVDMFGQADDVKILCFGQADEVSSNCSAAMVCSNGL